MSSALDISSRNQLQNDGAAEQSGTGMPPRTEQTGTMPTQEICEVVQETAVSDNPLHPGAAQPHDQGHTTDGTTLANETTVADEDGGTAAAPNGRTRHVSTAAHQEKMSGGVGIAIKAQDGKIVVMGVKRGSRCAPVLIANALSYARSLVPRALCAVKRIACATRI